MIELSSMFFEIDLFPVWLEQLPEQMKFMKVLESPTPLSMGIAF